MLELTLNALMALKRSLHLEEAAARAYRQANFQRCVTHVKRRLLARVRFDDTPKQSWQALCEKWQGKYRRFSRLQTDPLYRVCFRYLRYDHRMRTIIYTTNWIERLNKDFRRVLKPETAYRMKMRSPSDSNMLQIDVKKVQGKTTLD